jgi:predicted Zn finger-like uncharacterized protein
MGLDDRLFADAPHGIILTMSLATRCTACGTGFRVVDDQLKISGGWVRCGSCNEVFNASEHLFDAGGDIATAGGPGHAGDAADAARPRTDVVDAEIEGGAPDLEGDAEPEDAVPTPPLHTAQASADGVDTPLVQARADAGASPWPANQPLEQVEQSLNTRLDEGPSPVEAASGTATDSFDDGAAVESVENDVAAQVELADRPLHDLPTDSEAFDTTVVAESRPAGEAADSKPAGAAPPGATHDSAFRDSQIDAHLFRNRRAGSRRSKAAHVNERDRLDFSDARFDSDLMAYDDESGATDEATAGLAVEAPAAESSAPGFMKRGEATLWHRPRVRIGLVLGALALCVCLALQSIHHFHDAVAVQWPAMRAALNQWCAVAGCTIEPLRRIDAISVESTALAKAPGTEAFRLAIGLRNRASVPVLLPSVDLSLTDGAGRLVARKALAPAEFRPASPVLQAGSDVVLQTLLSARDLQVTGYTVEIFYP